MANLSKTKPGQKVNFSPINDKSKKLTGEITNYVFLAAIGLPDGSTSYALAEDIEILEEPKETLSEAMKAAIAEQVKNATTAPAPTAASPTPAPTSSTPTPAAPEWDEGKEEKQP